jgi:hypothetical protein
MRGLFFLLLLAVAGYYLYSHFPFKGKEGAALPPDTPLPVEATLAVGGSSSVVTGGRTIRYGLSAVSEDGSGDGGGAVDDPDATVLMWVQSAGQKRRSIQLSPADEGPVRAGPVSLQILGIEEIPDSTDHGTGYQVRLRIGAPGPPEEVE